MTETSFISKPLPELRPGWTQVFKEDQPTDCFEYSESVSGRLLSVSGRLWRSDDGTWQWSESGVDEPVYEVDEDLVGQIVFADSDEEAEAARRWPREAPKDPDQDGDVVRVVVDRQAGTITIHDPFRQETGTIRVCFNGVGWSYVDREGCKRASSDPDRNRLINGLAEGCADRMEPTVITEV